MPEGKYVSTFLSTIEKENNTLLCNLLTSTEPRDNTFVAVLKKHFEPKPLISERFKINWRQQMADESVAEYR